jgi:hypothetical protein
VEETDERDDKLGEIKWMKWGETAEDKGRTEDR